jgi:hypothetical protein
MKINGLEGVLAGKKTYIIMGLSILTAVIGYLTGQIGLNELIAAVFGALGLGSIRAGSKVDAAAVITSRPGTDTSKIP